MVDQRVQLHRISRIIAATRFPFVDQETWDERYQTIVNDEQKRFGIKWKNISKWKMLSNSTETGRIYKKFFLYVPHGYEEKALELLEENDVDFDGLRGYSIEDGEFKIYPHKTRNDAYDHR